MATSVKSLDLETMIVFRSKNPNDGVDWRGTLESVGSYRSIRGRTNPASYNEAVRQVDPSVSSDITTLTYFVITVDNGAAGTSTEAVFAEEWIEPGSLAVINLGNKFRLEVTDHLGDIQKILSLLAGAGYGAKVITG